MQSRRYPIYIATMRRMLRWVWLAVILGTIGSFLRTVPAPRSRIEPALASVDEPAFPPVHRLRPPAVLGLELRGRLSEGGPSVHLLLSHGPDVTSVGARLAIEPTPSLAAVGAAAGLLPYFPTGPPPIA